MRLGAVVERQAVGPLRCVSLGVLLGHGQFGRNPLDRSLNNRHKHLASLFVVGDTNQAASGLSHPLHKKSVCAGVQLAEKLGVGSCPLRIHQPACEEEAGCFFVMRRILWISSEKPNRSEFVVGLPGLSRYEERQELSPSVENPLASRYSRCLADLQTPPLPP